MAVPSRYNQTLSENLLTILCHSDEHGKLVAQMADPHLFEGELRTIAERAVAYWKKYKRAPKMHTADLVADILEDKMSKRRPVIMGVLSAMVELSTGINHTYVLDTLRAHTEVQRIKATILKSAERIQSQEELAIEEVRSMWYSLFQARHDTYEEPLTLEDHATVIQFLERRAREFKTGVAVLDNRLIVPSRKAMMTFLAPPGIGKSWGAVNVGKQALLDRQKVFHFSGEMIGEQVLQRYFQALLAIPKRSDRYEMPELKLDEDGSVESLEMVRARYDFAWDYDEIGEEIETRFAAWGTRKRNLRIKSYPPGYMTVAKLNAELDLLEDTEGFIPDILVLDAPYLFKIDPKNYRLDLGQVFRDVRGVAVARNMGLFCTHQISREGARAWAAASFHVAEDFSIVATSDIITTFTRTDMEARFGLGRLYVSKARDEKDKFGALITQNYDLGQFCLQSYMLPRDYDKWIRSYDQDDDDEEGDD